MGYRCISDVTLSEFTIPVNNRLKDTRLPISGTIELTYRCNLHCAHCYCNLPAQDRRAAEKELTTTQIFSLFDSLAERECLWLLFTGGEPLLRDDFSQIYLYAKRKGFLITLFTNATLITPDVAGLLREYPPRNVEVTIYGSCREVYERVTGVPGSFGRCMDGLRTLSAHDVKADLKTMVSTLNIDDLPRMKQLAGSLGAEFRFDTNFHPRVDGSRSPCGYRVSPEDVTRLHAEDPMARSVWESIARTPPAPAHRGRLYQCGAGRNTFFVDPYGGVGMCLTVYEPRWRLQEYPFGRIWDDFFAAELERSREEGFVCTGCEDEPFCDQCPGWGVLEHGDPRSISQYICDVGHTRGRAFRSGGGAGRPLAASTH